MAANRLKYVLEHEGIRQSELAGGGVSVSTLNKIVNNKRTASPTTNAKIVKALNARIGHQKYAVKDIFPD